MHDARQQRILRLFIRRILLLIALIFLFLLIPSVWSAYGKERESRQNQAEAEAGLNGLQAQQHEMEADVASLETERGKEDALRHRYDLAAAGEGVVYVVDPDASTSSAGTASEGFLSKLFSWWPF